MSERIPSGDGENHERAADGGLVDGSMTPDERLGTPEPEPHEPTGGARVCWLDGDEAADVIGALSSETARSIVTTLQERGHTASELAEAVDTSVQNVRHHLDNLENAGLVEVAGTRYSVKGREMTVYAAADERVVVAVGSEEESDSFFDSLRELLGSVVALVFVSGVVQWLFGTTAPITRVPDSTAPVVSTGLPPGAVFLAGGLLVVAAIALVDSLR